MSFLELSLDSAQHSRLSKNQGESRSIHGIGSLAQVQTVLVVDPAFYLGKLPRR
jgi:hypothetical protein